jgi:DNA-damage-inducible protein D
MNSEQIALFQWKWVRKIWYNDEWWFSVVDIVLVLTDSIDARKYWNKLKQRLKNEWSEVVTFCHQLKLQANDGKSYATDCSNPSWALRIIQSIPSPKAEPFKQRLASVGSERIAEINDPEIAMNRMKSLYQQKWYPEDRIDLRTRWIAVRQDLTREWKERWAREWLEYAILTNEITKATFGIGVSDYLECKWLDKQKHNLRDHQDNLELILTILGEATTTKLHKQKDSKWFDKLQHDAMRWWEVAGSTRIARYKNTLEPKNVVANRMRLHNTIEYLWMREKLHNANFKGLEFDAFKNKLDLIHLLYLHPSV